MSKRKRVYDEDFYEQISEVNPATENIDIGFECTPPLDVNIPALILDIRKVSIGYCVDTAIFADEVYNHSFIYKDGTSAIGKLRRFACMFETFNGNLASIVGKCALIKLKQTDYGMLYMVGINELTSEEANRMFIEIKEVCRQDSLEEADCEEDDYEEDYGEDDE